jgi:hypothetical protein
LESSHSVRDIFAVVREAPTEAPIELRLKQNDVTYCLLTIGVGETVSEAMDGFGLQPLNSGSQLSLDIVSLAQTSTANPGSDLTVTIRL